MLFEGLIPGHESMLLRVTREVERVRAVTGLEDGQSINNFYFELIYSCIYVSNY